MRASASVSYFAPWSASRPGKTSTPSSGRRPLTSPTRSARAFASSSRDSRTTATCGATPRRQIDRLDRLGHASSKADEGPREAATRLGWNEIPSAANADDPLPPRVNVFVTGGSRGIGRAIALRFARDGAKRIAIGYLRNDSAAEEAAEELRALGAEVTLVRGNVTSQRVLDEVAALGPLDVLVHNAATGVIRPALETEDKHWDWTMNANARALLQLARVAAPNMPDGSSIVALSSLGAQRVLDNYVLVGTSKAALESLVRYLGVELAPRIRVNAVSGGVVETGALEHFPNREEMLRAGAANPVGRLVTPDDIAGAVAFLCSKDADMIRGQTIIVDGGFSLLVSG